MNLKYSILWFDDSEEFLEDLNLDPLQKAIADVGLQVEVKFVSNAAAFAAFEPYSDFDLIAIDFNLEDESTGGDFIAKIRSHQVYTEVVFYSANNAEDLWRAIHESKLEGVFVASRSNIISKLILVSHQSLKKILDLDNMRGIVMAEVGDIDLILEEILRRGFQSLPQEKLEKIFASFHSDLDTTANKKVALLEEFKRNPTVEALFELSDSSKRWENFRRLLKHHENLKGTLCSDYLKEVLDPRNFLAHGQPQAQDDGSVVFNYNEKKFFFNEQIGAELRIKIGEYRNFFNSILGKIDG